MLIQTSCDSTRIAELESENVKLKETIDELNLKTAFEIKKWELAA